MGTGLLGILVAASATDINSTTPVLAVMIGLAVGIDYALFIISRVRGHLTDDVDPAEAAGRATATAVGAVVFAGTTVIVVLCGLSAARIRFLTTVGLASAAVVAVVIALTVVPALIGVFAALAHADQRLRQAHCRRPDRRDRRRCLPGAHDPHSRTHGRPGGEGLVAAGMAGPELQVTDVEGEKLEHVLEQEAADADQSARPESEPADDRAPGADVAAVPASPAAAAAGKGGSDRFPLTRTGVCPVLSALWQCWSPRPVRAAPAPSAGVSTAVPHGRPSRPGTGILHPAAWNVPGREKGTGGRCWERDE